MLEKLLVAIEREHLEIDQSTFIDLLNFPTVKDVKSYKDALSQGKVKLRDLKKLASEAQVPYPLFFAPFDIVKKQINAQSKELYQKMPSKKEIGLVSRGKLKSEDILLIVKDLSRKQEFAKKRLQMQVQDSEFVGRLLKMQRGKSPLEELANETRNHFGIDLGTMRRGSKNKALDYLCKRLEQKNVFVSRSSSGFMAQNIPKETGVSGFCIKDKKVPFIFLNNRDGEENPLIFETEGRQIFTLCLMIVSLGMRRFTTGSQIENSSFKLDRTIYAIAGEILLPQNDLKALKIENLEDLDSSSSAFSVTPSMLLMQLTRVGLIGEVKAKDLFLLLKERQRKQAPTFKRSVLFETGYGKYNGDKFSRTVVSAYKIGRISKEEACMVLFRRRKATNENFEKYINKYS